MAEEKEIICILCPLGCKLQVKEKPDQPGDLLVRGLKCKQGKAYAYEEYTNPTRILTSTVVIHGAPLPRLPVKTDKPIPKDLIFPTMDQIARVEVNAPVKIGTVLIEDLLGTGINLVASRTLKKNFGTH